MRIRTPHALLLSLATALSAVLTSVALAPPAQAAGPAPLVALLAQEGSVQVDCGPLPSGSSQFQVTYQRAGDPRRTQTTLPSGARTATIALRLSTSYTVTCRYRQGLFWSSASLPTTVRYPDLTLPVVRIDTTGAAPILNTVDYVPGTLSVNPNGAVGVPATPSVATEIRGRGNSTWQAPKKPYRIKLGSAQPLLGMPSSKHWVLLANWYDRTMLRSAIAFNWGTQSSLAWTPRTRFVEVVLNGDYVGVYQLTEHVRIDPNRVAIDPLTSADNAAPNITGGYLVELDERWDPLDKVGFRSRRWLTPFSFDDPEAPTAEQQAYFRSYVDDIETALADAPNGGAERIARVRNLIDTRSFADWYIVSEMARNYDSWYSSTWFYKPRNQPLRMGPLWDFDLSMGTYFFRDEPSVGFWVKDRSLWFQNLLSNPDFRDEAYNRYLALRPVFAATDSYLTSLDRQISTARANDKVRWGYTESMSGEVAELRAWLTARRTWVEGQLGLPAALRTTPGTAGTAPAARAAR